jgi:hypothetical protein
VPGQTNLEQIILSIQSCVFNSQTYYNEPGREEKTNNNIHMNRLFNQTTRECSIMYAIILPLIAALGSPALEMKAELIHRGATIPQPRPELYKVMIGYFALNANDILKIVNDWITDDENIDEPRFEEFREGEIGEGGFVISDMVTRTEKKPAPDEICGLGKNHTTRLKTLLIMLETLFSLVEQEASTKRSKKMKGSSSGD